MSYTDNPQAAEFSQLYAKEKPVLPDRLSQYHYVSCLADNNRKKAWILQKDNGQKILCKFASGEYADMLRTESTAFSLGKFRFVPYVFDYFETEEGAYLLREYIEGETLEEMIERRGPLSLTEAIPLMKQLCDMLSKFHACVPPVIHRDLKPANIVCQPSGDCYLIDMGTIRTYHKDGSPDTMFMGTPDTAAPEQFGARQTDNRTDIYSLGILFHYLLTARLKVHTGSLSGLPGRAASIIKKCVAFDPENRYADIEQVQTAILALLPDKKQKYTFLFGCISAAMFIISLCLLFLPLLHTKKVIVFSSALLEEAVRGELGKTNGEPVYEEDLAQITQLIICGDTVSHNISEHFAYQFYHTVNDIHHGYGDITDISILAKMPNLTVLILDYQNIYDITPLKGLPLTTLSLCGNPLWDLTALEGCTSLNKLSVTETAVTSLSPLEGCYGLTYLDCTGSDVASLAPITELPIRHLLAGDIPATDWDCLAGLPLQEFATSSLSVENLIYISGIISPQKLSAHNCGITSLKELACFEPILELDLNDNQIDSLEGLENFSLLRFLALDENPISDFSEMPKAENLISLTLPDTVTDYTFLFDMPQLKEVFVSELNQPILYKVIPEPWFEVKAL